MDSPAKSKGLRLSGQASQSFAQISEAHGWNNTLAKIAKMVQPRGPVRPSKLREPVRRF